MNALLVALDLLREARSRRWVLALALGTTGLLLLVAFGLELEVVDGALAASRFLGSRAGRDIRPADVALRPLFTGVAYAVFYGGPMLSSVLATVAAEGTLSAGVLLLLVYSAGFAVPMLLVGYGSQALRRRIRAISGRPLVVRWASGLLLVAFGLVILDKGMLFAGM